MQYTVRRHDAPQIGRDVEPVIGNRWGFGRRNPCRLRRRVGGIRPIALHRALPSPTAVIGVADYAIDEGDEMVIHMHDQAPHRESPSAEIDALSYPCVFPVEGLEIRAVDFL